MPKKIYFKTVSDDWWIKWKCEIGTLRFAWFPKIILKEIIKIRQSKYNEEQSLAIENWKEIYKFMLQVFESIWKKGLSPFVFYPFIINPDDWERDQTNW